MTSSFNPNAYKPGFGDLSLPPVTPGGLATGVDGQRTTGNPSGVKPPPAQAKNNEKDKQAEAEKLKFRDRQKTLSAIVSGNLKYPLNSPRDFYLQFAIYNYKSAQALAVNDIRQGLVKGGSGLEGLVGGKLNELISSDSSGAGLEGSSGTDPAANSSIGSIFLYLPPKLEYNYGATWNKVSFGALGNAIGQGGVDIGAALQSAVFTAGNFASNQVLQQAATIPKTEGISLDSLIGGSLGITFNDNTLQTFDRMNTRSFNFEYVMLARNQREENEIKNIIKKFKLAMHPGARRSGNNVSLFLDYPYIFRIMPHGGNNLKDYLPTTKYCALTRMGVDYTPNNSFNPTPGSFVHTVRISLNFEELTTLTQEDILSDEY